MSEGQAWRKVLSQHVGLRWQSALASKAGISLNTIHNLITKGNPSGSTLRAIASALGVAGWELLKEVEDEVAVCCSSSQSAPITDSPTRIEQKSSDSAGIGGDENPQMEGNV